MDYDRRRPTRRPAKSFSSAMKYVALLMALIYFCMGFYVLLASESQLPLSKQYKYIIGGMLIFYGIVRFVRAYQQHFKKNRRDEEF